MQGLRVTTTALRRTLALRRLQATPLLQRTFACGTSGAKDKSAMTPKKPRPADQYVNPSGTAFHHDALKAFLSLNDPSADEVNVAKDQIADALDSLRPDMLGPEATVLSLAADKVGDPALVLQVYRALRQARVQPAPLVLEISARYCASASTDANAWNTALDIIDEMHDAVHLMGPSTDIYERAIDTCAQAGKWIVALRLLNEMRRYNLEPSGDALRLAGQCCIAANELTALDKVLQMLAADKEYLDVDEVYGKLLLTAVNQENAAIAHHVLLHMHEYKQPTTSLRAVSAFWRSLTRPSSHAPLLELTPAHQVQAITAFAADQLWIELHQWLPVLGFPDYMGVDAYATSTHYMKIAFHIASYLKSSGVVMGATFYDALLQGCGRHQMLSEAKALLAEHPNVTISSYYFAITACQAHARDAEALFDAYSVAGINATGRHIKHQHTHADVCDALITCWSKARESRKILAFATELPAEMLHHARTMGMIMQAARSVEDYATVIDIFQQAKVHGVKCSAHMYADAMLAYARTERGRISMRLYAHMQLEEPMLSVHPVVINMLFQCANASPDDMMDVVVDAFYKMDRATSTTPLQSQGVMALYDVLAKSKALPAAKVAAMHDVWQVVLESPAVYTARDGSRPPNMLNKALLLAVNAFDVDAAENLVISAEDVGMRLSPVTCQLMMRLYSQAEDLSPSALLKDKPAYPDRFEFWWRAFQDHNDAVINEHTLGPLLLALLRGIPFRAIGGRRPFTVDDAWTLMQTHAIPLTRHNAEYLMRIYALDGGDGWDGACRVMNLMHDSHLRHTTTSLQHFAQMALATGDSARLNQLVEFLDAQDDDAIDLWHAVADVIAQADLRLRFWQAHYDRFACTLHARTLALGLTKCNSAAELRDAWQWLQQRENAPTLLLRAEQASALRSRLVAWGEAPDDAVWASLLARV
ncbi:hypothetical protein SPRG_01954 [Saprolegnia parasitica CBS 223.65]|uniref:Pentacotripeptide-repeat region of PRORP domain-containing protein n=1 Tax=Saprolegnia parasitica (strain CBS 223.65) TaxID=695850 RepID=A0A067D2B0_SAPPC|nr:hypothetical protein SPRG_01954 [Saprolegnia parasitica CBS 223.65]KDO33142.1 hypothetical protein SPRG_01954 [Saprolegnia parasitica CBS 223.65]|eukprot:XP_012195907.1 hypothetical protein SPRG_01954 [Saprolegnia parasitica CBS 223.65]